MSLQFTYTVIHLSHDNLLTAATHPNNLLAWSPFVWCPLFVATDQGHVGGEGLHSINTQCNSIIVEH